MRCFRLQAREGRGVVLVLHDLATAMNYADHVVVLLEGQVVHQRSQRPFAVDAPPEAARFLEATP